MSISFYLPVRKPAAALLVLTATVFGLLGSAQRADADDLTATVTTVVSQVVSSDSAPNVVPNFQKVSTGIWRGSAPNDAALSRLAKDGVKTIVDLRMDGPGVDSEKTAAQKLGINYYHFALGFNKPDADKIHDIMAVMTDPVNQPVFIHCRQGADRTGMLCGIYRHVWEGWSLARTYHEMREHHFKPFLRTMRRQVEDADLDQSLIAVRTKHPALIATAPPAQSVAKSASNSQPTGDFSQSSSAPDMVPGQDQPSSKNLLVVRPHREID
ncbi:MAG TPA: tyrosine-protein phosphatase [Trichormus sp.]